MNRFICLALVALAACAQTTPAPPAERATPFNDPENRPHPEVTPSFDVTHTKIEITLDPAKRDIAATATITLEAPGREFDDAITLNSVGLTYSTVTLNGKDAKWSAGSGGLTVITGRETHATIAATYTATPRHGLWWVARPPMIWSQGETEYNAHWFPCWAAPNDKTTCELIAHVPAGMTAISNGELVEQREGRWHWKAAKPIPSYLISVVVGDFDRVTIAPTVDVYVPKGAHDAGDVKRTFARTPDMIRFIAGKTGIPYPWEKYAQVVVKDFIWGGMENASCTTLYEHAVVPAKFADERDMDDLIVHELAHQWFGDFVTCRTWSEIWLNEGWATYWEALWAEKTEGIDGRTRVMDELAGAVFEEEEERYRRPMVTDGYTHPDDMFDASSYQKGGWVLHMLRGVVGDAAFWKGVHLFLERHALKSVTTQDFQAAMEEASGRQLKWFFDEWVHGTGTPEFEIKTTWDGATKSLRISAVQQQAGPVFTMPVEFDVRTGKGVKTVRAMIKERATDVYLALDEEPEFVEFDPRGWLLKRVKWEKPVKELLAQLKSGSLLGRAWAAAELGDADVTPAIFKALWLAVEGAPPLLFSALMGSLGKVDPQGVLGRLKGAKARQRRVMIESLSDDKAVDALVAIAKEDPSPYCRSAAWAALGKVGGLAHLLAAKSDDEIELRGIISGLAATRDEAAQAALLRMSAMPARIADALSGFKNDASRRRLLEMISDARYDVRMAAANALGEVGDAACAEILLKRIDLEVDGQMIQAMKRSARKLKP